MKTIGGFFELELGARGEGHHPEAVALTSGRACLKWILSKLKPEKVHLPFYICDSVLEPLGQLGISHEYYPITSELLPETSRAVGANECLLAVNYFGICSRGLQPLGDRLGRRLILDNTQNFFEKGVGTKWSFNSARKFFGVPDGGYLYGPECPSPDLPRNRGIHWDHLILRLLGQQAEAYRAYQESERAMTCEVLGISKVSEALLRTVEYDSVRERRRRNYQVYDAAFRGMNRLQVMPGSEDVPFCYPLWLENELDRTELHAQGIFVPTLWPEVMLRKIPGFDFERQLARRLLPLPLDHRYSEADCSVVIDAVKALIGKS